MPLKLTPFFTRKRVYSLSIRRSEEIQNTPVVLWTLSIFQSSIKPSEFFMTSKEDSNSFHSMDKKKISNFAEFKRNSLDQTKSAISLLTMVELLNFYLPISKSKTLLNLILRLDLLTESSK